MAVRAHRQANRLGRFGKAPLIGGRAGSRSEDGTLQALLPLLWTSQPGPQGIGIEFIRYVECAPHADVTKALRALNNSALTMVAFRGNKTSVRFF